MSTYSLSLSELEDLAAAIGELDGRATSPREKKLIAYPIPEPERSELIVAGARAEVLGREQPRSAAYQKAHNQVQDVINRIAERYGIDEPDPGE